MEFLPVAAAPIQLTRYHLIEQILQLHPDADLESPSDGVNLAVGAERTEHGERTLLTLLVSINEAALPEEDKETPPNSHHRGRVSIQGEFAWVGGDDLEADERDRLIAVNGLSVLYGIARVYVRQLSEPLPAPALMLPTLSFRDTIDALQASGQLPPALE